MVVMYLGNINRKENKAQSRRQCCSTARRSNAVIVFNANWNYTDKSILVTADARYEGRAEIRTFFSALMPQLPKQDTHFELDTMTVVDDLLFIVWDASTPTVKVALGSDTLLVRQGKIHRQTFVGQIEQISPGQ